MTTLVRLRLEIAAAAACAALCVFTLLTRDWIEVVLRVDPDRGEGWLEWLVVAVCTLVATAASIGARRDLLRLRAYATSA